MYGKSKCMTKKTIKMGKISALVCFHSHYESTFSHTYAGNIFLIYLPLYAFSKKKIKFVSKAICSPFKHFACQAGLRIF